VTICESNFSVKWLHFHRLANLRGVKMAQYHHKC